MAEPGGTEPARAGAAASAVAADTAGAQDTAAPRQPASVRELAWVFTRLALQGFGGVLPIAHRELVERERWLTPQQFVELLTTAQVLPGPNIINLALMLGDRCFGLRGALAAAGGLMAVPLAIVLALTLVYQQAQHLPAVAGALRGMGAVAAGLVIATALKLARTLKTNPLGRPAGLLLAAATLAAIAVAHWPLVGVVLVLGGGGMALAAARLRAAAGAGAAR